MPRPDPFKPAPLPVAPLDAAGRLACLRLIRSENVGPATFRALINQFGGAEAALAALPELSRRGGRRRAVMPFPEGEAAAELAAAARCGATPVFTIEPGYPARLVEIDHPPPMLYVRGRSELLNRDAIAIVGSREASSGGLTIAQRMAAELGSLGFVVVSGLARGIDAAAHRAALRTGTVAVLATGPDSAYPPENAELQRQIGEVGVLVSEQPPGFKPRGQDFPRRNRIVSGMSRAVVVIEATRRSGSLITARMAGEQGRDVLAVPGHPLDPRAEGTNRLIKDGATLVTEARDVVAALGPVYDPPDAMPGPQLLGSPDTQSPADPPDRDAHGLVLAQLGPAPVSVDALQRTTGLPARVLQGVLIELSLAGRIEHHGSQLVSMKAPAGD